MINLYSRFIWKKDFHSSLGRFKSLKWRQLWLPLLAVWRHTPNLPQLYSKEEEVAIGSITLYKKYKGVWEWNWKGIPHRIRCIQEPNKREPTRQILHGLAVPCTGPRPWRLGWSLSSKRTPQPPPAPSGLWRRRSGWQRLKEKDGGSNEVRSRWFGSRRQFQFLSSSKSLDLPRRDRRNWSTERLWSHTWSCWADREVVWMFQLQGHLKQPRSRRHRLSSNFKHII